MPSKEGSPQPGIGQPIRESVRVLGRYLWARILIGLILTVLYGVVFWAARVPFWPFIAIIGGFASLVPTIGSLIPIGLAALAIVLDDANGQHLLIAFGGWVVISALEGFVITPRLLSGSLGVRAWLVFVAVLAGSLLFGPVGFLLAAPAVAIGAVFWRHYRAKT